MKLTAKSVAGLSLQPGQNEVIHFDDSLPGFGIRLRTGAQAVWIFQFKINGQQRRKSLGRVSAMRLDVARRQAEELHAQKVLGRDPVGAIREERALTTQTFAAAVKEFMHWQRTRKRRDGTTGISPVWRGEVERYLNVYAIELHGLSLRKITRGDIARNIARVHREHGPVAGNAARKVLGALFAWAVKNAWTDVNPVIGTPKEEEASRDRVLLPGELRAIWQALGDDQYGAIVRLLLLTGLRKSEISGLRRSEIHDGAIVLPASRTKNRKPHVVPLTVQAQGIVEAQPLRTDSGGKVRDLLFGLAEGGFSGWGGAKERLDARIAAALGEPLPGWTLHDLRRTVATYIGGGLPAHLMAPLPIVDRDLAKGLQVPPHVIEAVLNHTSGESKRGVAGIYNRSSYEREKAQALDLWAHHLTAIIVGKESNVEPLRRA